MKKICCIVNPVSGLKKSLKVYYEAKNHFEKSNFNTSLFVSEYPNHIKDYVSKIDKNTFDRLIVFGGDGTINEVVNGLQDSNSLQSFKLGIVPTGVAWLLRFRILKNNGLIFQSQVSYLIPIFGTILGYIFLKELITIKVLISLIAVCIGIYFVKKADNKKII